MWRATFATRPSFPTQWIRLRWHWRGEHADYTEDQADTFVTDYVNAFAMGDPEFTVEDFDVVKLDNGFRVTATGEMQTMFLPLGEFTDGGHGINEMPVNITAEVVNASNRLELALVLDITGSMNCGSTVSGSCARPTGQPRPSTAASWR